MIRTTVVFLSLVAVISIAGFGANTSSDAQSGQGSMVIVFKDGHKQTVRMSDITRIEFSTPDAHAHETSQPRKVDSMTPGRKYFMGKWEVGDGNGSRFLINLKESGDAEKSIGAAHGTWTVVDGEARIAWDDGWHDAIRKVGSKHEKFAYEPGKSFSDQPANVTAARNTEPKPL
jgi:hypothetical protein